MVGLILEDGIPDRRHKARLIELMSSTTGIIRIASAYVTERQVLTSQPERDRRLLISLLPMDVASGAMSIESLCALLESGVECRVLPQRPRLHAKVYIFGSSIAVVTSANLTRSALDSNIEVGVELQGNETKTLTVWFDQLWSIASPLTVKQLADVQVQTAALRREFMKLKQIAKRKSPDLKTSKSKLVLSDSLQQLLANAPRFFVCNSDRVQGDRTPTWGFVLEEEMHNRGFATAWEDFKFPSHMEKVEPGDAIYMFAKGVGIIGIGIATGTYEKLDSGQDGRVSHVHDTIE